MIIPRGTFYQKTGGKWIYVVNKDGNKAVKREIRIGRQSDPHPDDIDHRRNPCLSEYFHSLEY